MLRMRGGNGAFALVLGLLVIALVALAALQYRWIGRISDAERERRQADAAAVAHRVANAVNREMQRTFESFLAPERDPVPPLYDEWLRDAPRRDLIAAVYVASRRDDQWSLQRLDLRERRLVPAAWTPLLEPMRAPLQRMRPRRAWPDWPPPLFAETPGLLIVQQPARLTEEFLFSVPERAIFVHFDRTALARFVASGGTGGGSPSTVPSTELALVVTGSRQTLGTDGAVEVAAISDFPPPPPRGARHPRGHAAPPLPPRPAPWAPPPPASRRRRPPPVQGTWTVVVRSPGGGLEPFVATTRRRNLAVSAGILMILAGAVAMLVTLLRRGERLRMQQAAFVTMMTHELNTPVAVLRGAGENLKDGIVTEREQIASYGRAIIEEADRLRSMTANILELSELDRRAQPRTRNPVALAPLIESVVARCRLVTTGRPMQIEVHLEPDLPLVTGDAEAVGRAIENLVVNAIRHGGSGEWIGVRARRDGRTVAVTVEDRGPGIDADDVAQLFEPFYRGNGSSFSDGTGLGLAIVKQIASAHGGSVTLDRREEGAAFTLHLPAVTHA